LLFNTNFFIFGNELDIANVSNPASEIELSERSSDSSSSKRKEEKLLIPSFPRQVSRSCKNFNCRPKSEFAKEWILENVAGRPHFNAMVKKDENHPVEEVGKELRKMMPWLEGKGL